MKRFLILIILFLISNSAFAALDGNFDYLNIPSERIDNIIFGKDTLQDILKKYPNFQKTKLDDGQTILSQSPKNSKYSEIRIGFSQNKLEWIEFILKNKTDLEHFLSRYGAPKNINKAYNPIYDYYDFDYFNVSTDKTGKYLYSITLFDNPQTPEELKELDALLPNWNDFNDIKVFCAKFFQEETFGDYFPSLYPKFNNDGSKEYTINQNIIPKYKKTVFLFKDGLLKKITIYPQSLKLSSINKTCGKPQLIQANKAQIIYKFHYFTVTTDNQNNVIKITI